MTAIQRALELIKYFVAKYEEVHGKRPVINRNKEKWSAREILEDISFDEARGLIDYYFEIKKRGHNFTWFSYNYDRLQRSKIDRDKDRKKRENLRQQTKQRLEEYRGVQ